MLSHMHQRACAALSRSSRIGEEQNSSTVMATATEGHNTCRSSSSSRACFAGGDDAVVILQVAGRCAHLAARVAAQRLCEGASLPYLHSQCTALFMLHT